MLVLDLIGDHTDSVSCHAPQTKAAHAVHTFHLTPQPTTIPKTKTPNKHQRNKVGHALHTVHLPRKLRQFPRQNPTHERRTPHTTEKPRHNTQTKNPTNSHYFPQ